MSPCVNLPYRLVALAALALAGCSTVKVNPTIFEKKSFALVSLTGDRTISSRNLATVGLVKMSGNAWGVKLTADLVDETVERLGKAVGSELVPLKKVTAAESYATLPTVSSPDKVASPRRLRPLDLSRKNDAALGKLAVEIGVDAVIALAHEYTIVTDRDSARQHAENEFLLIIVGADGTRLWEQEETLQSPPAEQTPEQRSRENLGVVTDEVANTLGRQAVGIGLAHFAAAWAEKAGLAAPPASAAP